MVEELGRCFFARPRLAAEPVAQHVEPHFCIASLVFLRHFHREPRKGHDSDENSGHDRIVGEIHSQKDRLKLFDYKHE